MPSLKLGIATGPWEKEGSRYVFSLQKSKISNSKTSWASLPGRTSGLQEVFPYCFMIALVINPLCTIGSPASCTSFPPCSSCCSASKLPGTYPVTVLSQWEAFASGEHFSEELQVIALILSFPPFPYFSLWMCYFRASFTRKVNVRIERDSEARISHQAVPTQENPR